MNACLHPRSALSVLAAGALLWSAAAFAQPRDPAGPMRAGLARPGLWGRDYAVLVASIPGWARLQEKTVVVAPDVVIGGSPFRSREEAEAQAEALRKALYEPHARLTPLFARLAGQAAGVAASKVSVERYGGGASYRVVVGLGLNLLPADLRLSDVERAVGKAEEVKREVDDTGGERRPLVLTGHVHAGGALVYQASNYAPDPDQVVRVVLNIPAALRALTEEQQ